MFDYFDFNLTNQKQIVKNNKKAIQILIAVFLFNVSMIFINFWAFRETSIWYNCASAGAMIMNTLWTFSLLFSYIDEQRHAKKILHYYEEKMAEKDIKDAIEECKKLKNIYERNVERYSNIIKAQQKDDIAPI